MTVSLINRKHAVGIGLLLLLPVLTSIADRRLPAEQPEPPITASFLDPGAFIHGIYPAKRRAGEADVRAKIDAMHELGIETIVITYPEYIINKWGAFYASSLPELNQHPNPLGFDLVEAVLSQAGRHSQSVMLGIGRGTDLRLTYDGCDDPTRLQAARSFAEKVIRELHAKYADRHECFAGWYITHECRNIRYASPYYDYVADLCHSLTPGKPVMIAPDGSPIADSQAIADSGVDIFAYQDAVGPGFVPPPNERYSYDPEERLATLGRVFGEYARWHADNPDKQIWATVEIWQMDGPEYTDAYPADWSRVARQIDAVRQHVSRIVIYECGGFLESPNSKVKLGGPRAVRLFNAYKETLTATSPRPKTI